MDDDSLTVDLGDPDDVQAKLPRAYEILRHKEDDARQAIDVRDKWRSTVTMLARLAGVSKPDEPAAHEEFSGTSHVVPQTPSAQAGASEDAASDVGLVVEVVNREPRKIPIADVIETLQGEGHHLGYDRASNALAYAARQKKIWRPGRGWYAPLTYTESAMIETRPPALRDEGSP